MPPPLTTTIGLSTKYRFQKSGTITAVITRNDIIRAIGSMQITSTSLRSICDCFILHYVEVWSTAATGEISSVQVEWIGDSDIQFGEMTHRVSDSSLSSAYPSHVVAKPKEGTFQSKWLQRVTESDIDLFSINTTGNSVLVDIMVSAKVIDRNGGLPTTTSTGTTGEMVYCALNGLGGSLVAVGRNRENNN